MGRQFLRFVKGAVRQDVLRLLGERRQGEASYMKQIQDDIYSWMKPEIPKVRRFCCGK